MYNVRGWNVAREVKIWRLRRCTTYFRFDLINRSLIKACISNYFLSAKNNESQWCSVVTQRLLSMWCRPLLTVSCVCLMATILQRIEWPPQCERRFNSCINWVGPHYQVAFLVIQWLRLNAYVHCCGRLLFSYKIR